MNILIKTQKYQKVLGLSLFILIGLLFVLVPKKALADTTTIINNHAPLAGSSDVNGVPEQPYFAVGSGSFDGDTSYAKLYVKVGQNATLRIDGGAGVCRAGGAVNSLDVGSPIVTYTLFSLNATEDTQTGGYTKSMTTSASAQCGDLEFPTITGQGTESSIAGHEGYRVFFMIAKILNDNSSDNEKNFQLTSENPQALVGVSRLVSNVVGANRFNIYQRNAPVQLGGEMWNYEVEMAPRCSEYDSPNDASVLIYDADNGVYTPQNLSGIMQHADRSSGSYAFTTTDNYTGAAMGGNHVQNSLRFTGDNTYVNKFQIRGMNWRNTVQLQVPFDQFDAQHGEICHAVSCQSAIFVPTTVEINANTKFTAIFKNTGLGTLHTNVANGYKVKYMQIAGPIGSGYNQVDSGDIPPGGTAKFTALVHRSQAGTYTFTFQMMTPGNQPIGNACQASFNVRPGTTGGGPGYSYPTGDITSDCTFVSGHIHGGIGRGALVLTTDTEDARTQADAPGYAIAERPMPDAFPLGPDGSFIIPEWWNGWPPNPPALGGGIGTDLIPTHSYHVDLIGYDSDGNPQPVVDGNLDPVTTVISPPGPGNTEYGSTGFNGNDSGKCLHVTSCSVQINDTSPEPGEVVSGAAYITYANFTDRTWDFPYYGVRTETSGGVNFISPAGNQGPNTYLSSPMMAYGYGTISVPFTVQANSYGTVGINLDTSLPGQNPANGGRLTWCTSEIQPATRPYLSAHLGDVSAGGMFGSAATNQCSLAGLTTPSNTGSVTSGGIRTFSRPLTGQGSGTDRAAFSLGLIDGQGSANGAYGFNSAVGVNGYGYNALDFANTTTTTLGGLLDSGGVIAANHCTQNYFTTTQDNPGVITNYLTGTDCDGNGASFNVSGQKYLDTVDIHQPIRFLSATESQYSTLPNDVGICIKAGKRITVYVKGDVDLSTNIYYQRNGWSPISTDPNKEPPYFALVVLGNIYVDPSVNELDGLYVAQPDPARPGTGVFQTCSPADSGGHSTNPNNDQLAGNDNLFHNCNNIGNNPDSFYRRLTTLTVNGAVVAQQVINNRTGGTLSTSSVVPHVPAEIYNYIPSIAIGQPNFKSNTGAVVPGQNGLLFSLPPVF